jgi:glycine cleavage system H protein
METPNNLKYSTEHEWVRIEGNIAYVGITDFAQSQLGDIVYLDIDTLNLTLVKGEVFGNIEAVKTVSPAYMPLSGKVIEINEKLNDAPEVVNHDPYNEGWMIKIELSNSNEIADLLDAQAYNKLCA